MTFSSSFEVLYHRFQPELVGFAIYYVRSKSDAMEIVNDVFMNVWKKKDNLVFDDSLKSYLYTATKNASLNFLKRKGIEQIDLDVELSVKSGELASDLIEVKEDVNQINKLLLALPPKCQQVFIMSRVSGLSNKEIATFMEISIKTVENQMTKALKHFKEKLNLE